MWFSASFWNMLLFAAVMVPTGLAMDLVYDLTMLLRMNLMKLSSLLKQHIGMSFTDDLKGQR